MLVKKDPKLKYTDMAIWIDANVDNPNLDSTKMYDYIVMLTYMLARKRRFFSKTEDYEMFCYYVANSVFMRLTSPKRHLSKDDPNYLPPVKSVLNYLKNILYGRKYDYMKNNFREISNVEVNEVQSEALRGYVLSGVNGHRSDLMQSEVCVELLSVDKIILRELKNGTYGNDKLLCHKLYISVLITLLRNFTLSNKNKARLECYDKSMRGNFDTLLASILEDETKTSAVTYDIDETYLPYVKFIASKVKTILAKDVKEIIQEYEITDEMASDILLNEYQDAKDGDD